MDQVYLSSFLHLQRVEASLGFVSTTFAEFVIQGGAIIKTWSKTVRRARRPHSGFSHIFANRAKTISASEPAFKPRKVKKEGKYRDRAAERRVGGGNDYAQVRIVTVLQPISHKVQVEAILDDFNKRTADQGKDVVRSFG